MREYSTPFEFSAGLRPSKATPVNSKYLTRALNLVVRDKRLSAYEDFMNPITDPGGLIWPITLDWPFPQIFDSYGGLYLGSRLGIYRLDSNFIPTIEVGVDFRDTIWSMADFGQYVVFTNGAMIYVMDVSANDLHPHISPTIPVAGCITAYRGQLMAGRVDGYAGNVVVWSHIGWADMTLDRSATAGNIPLPSAGNVLALKTLGDFVVAYSQDGITILRPFSEPISTYGIVAHYGIGIAGPGCVAGDARSHTFIDEFGTLRTIDAQGTTVKLGYQEFMSQLTSGTIMMSYDPGEGDIYISDGNKNFLLTKEGLTEIHQGPTSLIVHNGELVGPYYTSGDPSWVLVTDTQDLGNRSKKTIQGYDLAANISTGSIGAYINNLNVGVFNILQVRSLSPKGQARIHLCGNQFRHYIAGVNRTNLVLDNMRVMWKQTDKTFIRGAYATQTAT